MGRTVAAKFEVDWTGTDTWVDESAYLVSAAAAMQLSPAPASSLLVARQTH